MSKEQSRFRDSYSGMVVNNRKVDEAIMIGDDIVIMPVRIIGNYVRIGIASRSGIRTMREETYREFIQERLEEGPLSSVPVYRLQDDSPVPYTLTSQGGNEAITSVSEMQPDEGDLTIVKFGSRPEAEAYAIGIELATGLATKLEPVARDWYALTCSRGAGRSYRCLDYSLPWQHLSD